ncbi:unnamed protein product, partial [Owenia fusiformis]
KQTMAVNRRNSNQNWTKHHQNGTKTLNNNNIHKQKSSRDFKENNGYILVGYFFVTFAAIACYLNSVKGELVHDDIFAIKNNQDVSPNGSLSQVFKNDFWGKSMSDNTSHKSYRPLCVLTFRLNYLVHGLHPVGYHIVNICLHAVNTILLLNLCHGLVFDCLLPSFVTSLLFAVHPIHTEAVSGVVGRADVLACTVFLISLQFYIRSIDTRWPGECPTLRSPCLFLVSLLLGGTAMLVKEHGVTVLGVGVLYDAWVLCNKTTRRVLEEKWPTRDCYPLLKRITLVVLVVLLCVCFRVWMMNRQSPAFTEQDNPAAFSPFRMTRVLTYMYLISLNCWLLLYPRVLCYDWQVGSIPIIEQPTDLRNFATFLTICAMGFILYHIYATKAPVSRPECLGITLLVVPFLPASNLFFTVGFVIAERILYIPSMGYCVLLAYGLDRLTINFRWKPRSALAVAMAMAAILAGRTVVRNQVWHSRETLFKSGIEVLPNNAKVHYNYANYLKDVGKTTEAIKHYEKAILLYPKHASAHNNLGTLLNNSLEAEDHFWRAIAINPQHAGAHFNLGNVMHAKNKLLQAEKFLLEAINLEPNSVDSYTNLAAVYADLKEFTYADTYYRKALQVAPHDPNCFNNYGVYLNKIGKPEQALKYYERAYTIDPSHQVSIVNAARLLRSLERNIEAENLFRSALWIERNPGTLDLAGIFYFNTAEPDTALELFQEALFKDPHNADVKVHYAQVLTSLKQYDKAEELILQVLETQIDHVEALKHLANMYGILKKHSL